MRTQWLLASVVLLAGCSLVYNGSRYTGGTGTDGGGVDDTGTPDAFVLDTGPMPDARLPDGATGCSGPGMCGAGNRCESGACVPGCNADSDCRTTQTCDTTTHLCACALNAECGNDSFCASGHCTACDADADGYITNAATGMDLTHCTAGSHMRPGDCNDDPAMNGARFHPYAVPDCSTPMAESCGIPVVDVMPNGANILESGVTDELTIYTDMHPSIAANDPIYVILGDDSPILQSGDKNGFVAFTSTDPVNMTHTPMLVKFDFDNVPGVPQALFGAGADAEAFTIGRASDASHNQVIIASMAWLHTGDTLLTTLAAPTTRPSPSPFTSASAYALPTALFGTRPQTAIADGNGAGATVLPLGPVSDTICQMRDASSCNADTLCHFSGSCQSTTPSAPTIDYSRADVDAIDHATGGANVMPDTWMVGAGQFVMWMASQSSLGVWNTSDSAISPPLVNIPAMYQTSNGNVAVLQTDRRGSLSVTQTMDGRYHYVAAVLVTTTARPPTGYVLIARWQAPNQNPGDRTDAIIPSAVSFTQLSTTALDPTAGVAVRAIDGSSAIVTYVDGRDIVAREVSLDPPLGTMTESPPTITLMHLGTGESCTAIGIDGGLYLNEALGRFGVAAVIQNGAGANSVQIRGRALESCVAPCGQSGQACCTHGQACQAGLSCSGGTTPVCG